MFGLGLHPAFLIVLFIIVLIVFGPGKLPEMAGAAGRMLREFRKASDDVTGEIRRALDLPEGQGTNLLSAQGLIEQLTREPEASTVTEVTVPMETETEADATETEGTEQTQWTPPTEELDADPVGTFGPPEIDGGVYASLNDGSPVEGNPFEEPMSAGHHEPSSAVMAPPEELSAVDRELAKDPDPVDQVEEAREPAMEPSAAVEPEPAGEAGDVTEAPAPSATVEEPGTSPEEASSQPPAAVNDPTEPEEDGGEKTGEGTA